MFQMLPCAYPKTTDEIMAIPQSIILLFGPFWNNKGSVNGRARNSISSMSGARIKVKEINSSKVISCGFRITGSSWCKMSSITHAQRLDKKKAAKPLRMPAQNLRYTGSSPIRCILSHHGAFADKTYSPFEKAASCVAYFLVSRKHPPLDIPSEIKILLKLDLAIQKFNC